jgi:hypothetical protein
LLGFYFETLCVDSLAWPCDDDAFDADGGGGDNKALFMKATKQQR